MIVEFCGIPGGGKSTLARIYVEKYPQKTRFVTVDMYKKTPEFFYANLFAISHPASFFWMLMFVMRYHMKDLFFYSFHLALRACAKYQKASFKNSSNNMLIIDEGLVHILCTLSAYALTQEQMKKWIDRIVLPDVVCLAKSGTFHRFHGKKTPIHPRVAKGENALNKWETAVRANVLEINEYLQKKRKSVWNIPEQGFSPKVLESLHTYLQNK